MLRQRGRSGLGRLPLPAALCGPCACLACSRPSVSVRQVYAFSARALVLLFPVSPSPARLKQPAALRAEGRTVLLHCVQARSRTPAVAALYAARHRGVGTRQALAEIGEKLPRTSL